MRKQIQLPKGGRIMILYVQQHQGQCIITIEGRIDPHTCPILHEKTQALDYDAIQEILFDFRDVVYISAAGLRELLVIRKRLGPEKAASFRTLSISASV